MPTFRVPAGTGINIDFPARYMLIDSITSGLSVNLKSLDPDIDIDLTVRGGGKLTGIPKVIQHWRIHNDNGIDVDVVIQGGAVLYDENRIDGDVNSLVRFDDLSQDETEFFGGNIVPASAGQYSFFCIFNPAGSGVDVSVDKLWASCGYGEVTLQELDAAAVALLPTISTYFANKKLKSATQPKAKMYYGYGATPWVSAITDFISYTPVDTSGTPVNFNNGSSPILLPEGVGLCIGAGTLNYKLAVTFAWSEN